MKSDNFAGIVDENSIDYDIIGIDEAGRGPIFGPVVAAAVYFDSGMYIEGIRDSKVLNEDKREELYEKIFLKAKFGIGTATPEEIDIYNIFHATELAMNRALEVLKEYTEIRNVYIDGKNLKLNYPSVCVVKGDQKIYQISAASVLAKVTRDRLMKKFHTLFPFYNLATHKGYPTKEHIEALKNYGPTIYHRLTFGPVKNVLNEKLLELWLKEGLISEQRYEIVITEKLKAKDKKDKKDKFEVREKENEKDGNLEVDLFGNKQTIRTRKTNRK